jgi:RND family efflux transporter MFP subunit
MDQQIAVLKPTVQQTREALDQTRSMAEQGVATARELSDAQAAYDQAVAQLRIAQQARENATLTAPFRALIVQRFVERFENVQAGQPVVRLQDRSNVDVQVELPESVVARYQGDRPGQTRVQFAALPGRLLPVAVKEASAEADTTTGGYPVTFTLPQPEGVTLLPGMGATILLIPSEGERSGDVAVPLEAVFLDDALGRCVWRLAERDGGLVAERVPVKVVQLAGDVAIVSEGLEPGCRVATAGIHFLREGLVVRPMEQKP